jgi:hypothetical protein
MGLEPQLWSQVVELQDLLLVTGHGGNHRTKAAWEEAVSYSSTSQTREVPSPVSEVGGKSHVAIRSGSKVRSVGQTGPGSLVL